MRTLLVASVFTLASSAAWAETWVVREGACGEWQSRWDVEQEQTGVWVGTIDHVHVGGPCVPATRATATSEVRAVIAGDNLFALRTTDHNILCTYVARIERENRGRGVTVCEGVPQRGGFVVRFRERRDVRPMREMPPDDDLFTDEQRRRPDLRFEFRGLDQLFGR
ncbi:hypothetical protein [Salinarimonas soli]|uniref:Uncharacterized protein n=1 Tax=Salinarimonas soli TaxID=1638099 RepID=A0A5B2V9Y3_9HYPH|nr:hypothetical protein [Salinarimonas soli]KAA2235250.1 hypothetical protein F0L46_21140 [Salinarimonas soli]